jgi:hypothetical protein
MKKQMVVGLFVCALMLGLAIAPAHAQDNPEGKITVFGGYSYGTNNFGCDFDFGCSSAGLHGYSAAVTYNFSKNIGLEANFSGHNGSSTVYSQAATVNTNGEKEATGQDLYSYTFGPKLTLPLGNFAIFTHFLVGAAHVHESAVDKCILATGGETSCFNTDYINVHGDGMAFKTGGGVDWNHGRWGIRILEVDYVRNQASVTETCTGCNAPENFTIGANNFELSTGVKVNFK